MKVFLINLDADTERLAKCDAQLRRLGVSYERVPAILGKALSKAEKDRAVNRFLWWCNGGRKVMDGEIGCALSHYACFRRIIDGGLGCACILEDDVILDDRFPEVLKRVEFWIQSSAPQVVLLSNHSNDLRETDEIVEVSGASFAEGYVITASAAERIMKVNTPLRAANDSWTRWRRRAGVRLFRAYPSVCRQDWSDGFKSRVCTEHSWGSSGPAVFQYVVFKLSRLVGKTIDVLIR